MKNKILIILLSISLPGFSQSETEQAKIRGYLESTIKYSNELILTSISQSVLASDIIQSKLTFNTGESYGNEILQEQYFLKSDNKLTPFRLSNDLLASSEFIKSVKSKKFTLTNEDDALAFQSMLSLLDNERGLGFFKENNVWYFIRDEFFDDIEAYVVTTDKKGQIAMVAYEDELKKTLPETLLKSGEILPYTDTEKADISEKDSAFMHQYLLEQVQYAFEISPLDFYSINKISNISLHKCSLKVTEGDEEMSSTSISSFMLVSNNNEYIKQASVDGLIEMPLFLKSLQEKYQLKTEDDARLFQYVLDDLTPVSRSDIELKTFYKKDNMWFFIREKSFDDLKGYILVTDNENKVSYIEYATISEESVLRIKMKDPNFKADYKFNLVKPASSKVKLKDGEGLSVEISFDADMANASGAWIMTRFDGQNSGMYAGTSIESPYTDGITGMALENSHHTLEYFLLKNGVEDTEDALGVIKIEITVER